MSEHKHPRGLYVLFFTEMWERFSFYSMLALFTLYMISDEGFGWSKAEATSLYSTYLAFVYASPIIGGWLADWKLGYRRSVMIGGFFFMAGHLLLSFHSLAIVYLALACLVIGNGFFKPNVSTMVGKLYPEGSPLRDKAYLIFYLGINVGAFLAPVAMEYVKTQFNVHLAFGVAAVGMVFSVATLWWFQHLVEEVPEDATTSTVQEDEKVAATAEDLPPLETKQLSAMEQVPEWKRITALCVIYCVSIVFWMVFHQNGSTLTYWADNNTKWQQTGTLSNAINPAWILILTFPLIGFWSWLNKKGLEPSTPLKMVFGMLMCGLSFFILYLAAKQGEAVALDEKKYHFVVSPLWLIGAYGVMTLGELMLSPMGLSLVSKVAPMRLRGLMMGGWFMATAIGNKLTAIGVLWEKWLHSDFFILLAALAGGMAVVLFLLLRPLKKAMPGV